MKNKRNIIVLLASSLLIALPLAEPGYIALNYNSGNSIFFVLTLLIAIPFFVFTPKTRPSKLWLICQILLTILTGWAIISNAYKLNPCSNGCDDTPILIAWLAGFAGLLFWNFSTIWRYWLFLLCIIHIFAMKIRIGNWEGGWEASSEETKLQWHQEFYTTAALAACVIISLYLPLFFRKFYERYKKN